MPIEVGPFGFPENVNPLTGLVVDDVAKLNRRPIFVKVTNFPRTARPQAGLSLTDMVFDYYTGAGVNRFALLFYGQDAERVGPVRSGRLADGQLVPMYQGIMSCGSADQLYVWPTLIEKLGYYRIFLEGENSCPAMCRDDSVPERVNSLFTNTAALTDWAVRREVDLQVRFDLEGMYFNSTPPASSESAEFVALNYYSRNRAEWHYDPATAKYLKWIEDIDDEDQIFMIPHIDRNTDQQIAFSNVVVMFAEYLEYGETLHDIVITGAGRGRAVLFRDGKKYEGYWRVVSRYKPLQFFDMDGNPLAFKPGNSWVMIAGLSSTIKEEPADHWEVHFYLP